jgi:hypothetical protein
VAGRARIRTVQVADIHRDSGTRLASDQQSGDFTGGEQFPGTAWSRNLHSVEVKVMQEGKKLGRMIIDDCPDLRACRRTCAQQLIELC